MPQITIRASYVEGVALDGTPTNIVNQGPGNVFYGDSQVSASNNLGTIASGAAKDFNTPTYLLTDQDGTTVQANTLAEKPINSTGVTGDIPVVSGAKGGNAALGSLMTALVSLGLVQDTTSA